MNSDSGGFTDEQKMQKRFIAGAICPRCAAQDRIVMFRRDDQDIRECVECGFSDVMHFHLNASEIATRVNQSEALVEKQTSIVKILPGSDDTI